MLVLCCEFIAVLVINATASGCSNLRIHGTVLEDATGFIFHRQ